MSIRVYSWLFLLLAAGCASLPPSNVETFSSGVTAARNQTTLAFQAVTDLTSQSIIDYAAAQATLTDSNFLPVLPPDSVATWDAAFGGLQKYSQNLVLLTSPNLAKDYEDAVANLAAQVKQTGDELKSQKLIASEPALSPSLAAAFTELSSLLLRAKAQHDARVILLRSDPVIRQIFTNMAYAIGDNQNTALRGTVHAHWEQNKAKLKVAFLSTTKPEERRSLAAQYSTLLASEVTQDLALASLQRSFLALADAHHALANGRNASLATAISAVEQEVQHTYDLSNRFQKIAH
ncbi:MAG TPA: hypothetical protein VN578_12340 [Candidatus Binatia bacterium]|nr:hypothetical protein [Candidatus Binatia bacterium]